MISADLMPTLSFAGCQPRLRKQARDFSRLGHDIARFAREALAGCLDDLIDDAARCRVTRKSRRRATLHAYRRQLSAL